MEKEEKVGESKMIASKVHEVSDELISFFIGKMEEEMISPRFIMVVIAEVTLKLAETISTVSGIPEGAIIEEQKDILEKYIKGEKS